MKEIFCKRAIEAGGTIASLILDNEAAKTGGIMNPSVFIHNSEIMVNIRCMQYILYHSEKKRFEHQYGPLVYLNPQNDITLTTTNYLCRLTPDLKIKSAIKVDTSLLDKKPLWEFVGLEDARLVLWAGRLYLAGVRRDTTTTGEGRMELSEIDITTDTVNEIHRLRIPAPGKNDSLCEKNWMPILDQPFHFVKWTNPTEIVKVDPLQGTCETTFLGEKIPMDMDLRGSSQAIPWKGGHMAIVHTTNLFNSEAGRKDGTYRHRFAVWDKDWNLIKTTEPFTFLNAEIEFCCGMAEYQDSLLITFGFQDNGAFIVKVPKQTVEEIINE